MSEYKVPTSKLEFEENFSQKKPLMSDNEAHYESSRCLFCYDAPCIQACPSDIDIPLFIKQIHTKNEIGAAKTIYDSNYMGYTCGKVCPTEVLCEGSCVYNEMDQKPLEIGRLQAYATLKAMNTNARLYHPKHTAGQKVAIIGAGSASIACACELRLHGVHVAIYEAKENPTGLNYHGIAPYKLTNEEALQEAKYLEEQFGYTIFYNAPILSKTDLQELEGKYDAIFIGVGLGATSEVKVPGEDKEGCIGAVEFIEELRTKMFLSNVGKRVVVIGGGNTAIDAACESARMGAESVILAYRRSKSEMRAYEFEYKLAKESGVKGQFNIAPVEILGDEKVSGIKLVQTRINDGKVEYIEGSEFIIECDMVIKATGQSKQSHFFEMIEELRLDEKGRIVVDENSMQTTNPKYFSGGDAVNGGKEVVNAAAEGKKAGKGILRSLSSNL